MQSLIQFEKNDPYDHYALCWVTLTVTQLNQYVLLLNGIFPKTNSIIKIIL